MKRQVTVTVTVYKASSREPLLSADEICSHLEISPETLHSFSLYSKNALGDIKI